MVSLGKSGGGGSQAGVWDVQTPALENLYGRAESLYNDQSRMIEPASTDLSNKFGSNIDSAISGITDTSFLGSVSSGTNLGMTGYSDIISGNNPGMSTMRTMMDPEGNPYLQGQIDDMWSSIGRNTRENILPGLRSEESVLGNYGGSRGSIAEGMIGEEAIRSGSTAERGLRGDAYSGDMSRALQAALGYTGAVGEASRGYTGSGLTADQLEASRFGMVPGLAEAGYNLGMAPYGESMDYINAYAQAIGRPTVLNASHQDTGWNFGFLNG